ncbi:MAG: MarR family transcriptional [Actinobacteria bacterium]|nr:MAG: MarR family transcriptional [Actinomycetota bacterium]
MQRRSERLSHLMPLLQHATSHLGALSTESGRSFALSKARMAALSTLMHRGRLRMSDLADLLDLPRPLATRAVNELVARGLLERCDDPADRRTVLVQPTAAGRAVYEDVQRESATALEEVLTDMIPGEVDALLVGLESLLEALHKPGRGRKCCGPDDPDGHHDAHIGQTGCAHAQSVPPVERSQS